MKYDILEQFKGYVYEHTKSPNTARKYYSSVKMVLSDLQFNMLQEITTEQLEQRLAAIKTKNEFSAAKNGLRLLKEYDPDLPIPDESFFSDTSIGKRNHRRKADPIYIDTVKRKVNQIADKKLKLAYRLAMISGLRVSELEELTPEDIAFLDSGKIVVNVRKGKGGKAGKVNCMEDSYVYTELQAMVSMADSKQPLFYSQEKMRKNANKLGLECHDFRRMYAYIHKKQLKKSGMSNYKANKVIQGNLRHSRYKTTKRYLYGKKFVE